MQNTQPEPQNLAPMAAAFEASLAIVAIAVGWLVGVEPLQTLAWSPQALAVGAAASAPLFLLLWLIVRYPWGPLGQLRKTVDDLLGSMFRDATWADLALVSLMAGIGEEVLFRGVVQTAAQQWMHSPGAALVVAGILFGLMHSVTRTYAIMAGLVGIYLGWLWLATGNLLTPIATHAIYDFGALCYLRRTSHHQPPQTP